MKMWTIEQWRMVTVSVLSPVLGYYTPTGGFVMALVIMFAFNIWSGCNSSVSVSSPVSVQHIRTTPEPYSKMCAPIGRPTVSTPLNVGSFA